MTAHVTRLSRSAGLPLELYRRLAYYFAKRSLPKKPRDLTGDNCISLRLPTYGGLYAWEFEKGGRELRVCVEGQFVHNGTTPMLNAALAGLGLAYVPEDLAQPYIDKGALKRVLEDWCPPISGSHLYYPSRRQSSPRLPCWSMRCAIAAQSGTPPRESVLGLGHCPVCNIRARRRPCPGHATRAGRSALRQSRPQVSLLVALVAAEHVVHYHRSRIASMIQARQPEAGLQGA